MKSLNTYISLSNKKISSLDDYISVANERISSIDDNIIEKLHISKSKKIDYFVPNSIDDLVDEIIRRIQNTKTDTLDLSYIDCSNLINLESLFRYVHKKLNNGLGMSNIKIVNVSDWNVSSISNFEYCFTWLDNVEHIEGLDTWDMSNANTINGMFYNCKKLKELDLNGWELHLSNKETFGHRTIERIFLSCHSLEEIKGLEKWTFGKAHTLRSIFKNCKSLKTIKGIENWDMSNINYLYGLFGYMESLINLDLSKWDVSKLNKCTFLFKNCSNLKSIAGISKWDVQNLLEINSMFEGCTNLACDISDWNLSISCTKTNAFKYTNSKIFKKPNVFKKQ